MKKILNRIFSFFTSRERVSIENIKTYLPELSGQEAERLGKTDISFGTGKQRSAEFYKESFPWLSDGDAEAIRCKLND